MNYNGLAFLPRCLDTLLRSSYSPLKVVVADNCSTDGSLEFLRENYPSVETIEFRENLGYSGAYNAAVPMAEAEYVVLLNFDVEVEPDWLDQAVTLMEGDSKIVAVQPKLRSLQRRHMFEYSGGSGGFIDRYGYPFVRGRVFDVIEEDLGQYDDPVPLFWASGAALITRKSAFVKAGGFDPDFFMHMEELDLCWRYRLYGYDIRVAPKGVVYHYAGAALSADRYQKMYLNHRNGLVMLVKNYSMINLCRNLPIRLMLDWVTVVQSLFGGRGKRSLAVLAAHWYLCSHLRTIWRKRRAVQSKRVIPDSALGHVIFPFSVVWRYFVKKQKYFSQLTANP